MRARLPRPGLRRWSLLLALSALLTLGVLVPVTADADEESERFIWCTYTGPAGPVSQDVINAKFWFRVAERAEGDRIWSEYLPDKGHELLTEGFNDGTTFTFVRESVLGSTDLKYAEVKADIEIHEPNWLTGQVSSWTVSCSGGGYV
jgi:hypothetical protein